MKQFLKIVLNIKSIFCQHKELEKNYSDFFWGGEGVGERFQDLFSPRVTPLYSHAIIRMKCMDF